MNLSGRLLWLRDPRLAPLAVSDRPAWLWSTDATQALWANPTGAAIFGAANPAALAARKFDAGQPAAAQVARLAATLRDGEAPRLEKLRGFGAGVGRALACNCSRIALSDGTDAVLVAATGHAGPDLALNEKVHRLLAGVDEAVAAFAPNGALIHATTSAQAKLADAQSLAALGIETAATDVVETGHAAAVTSQGPVTLDRIGDDDGAVLIATFSTNETADTAPSVSAATQTEVPPTAEVVTASVAPSIAPPVADDETPAASDAPKASEPTAKKSVKPGAVSAAGERRHPLRFVWQMDADNRFTVGSDEFIALIGSRTAAALGRPWQDIAAELNLDPDSQIARAIGTLDTWSGVTVAWPVGGGGERLATELSGLPVFDRDRVFRGYRGFGVCRDLKRLGALIVARATTSTPPATPPLSSVSAAGATEPENIVPFRAPAEPSAPSLNPVERRAFRELARRLTEQLTATGVGTDAELLTEEDGIPATAPPPPDPTLADLAEAAKAAAGEGAPHDSGNVEQDLFADAAAEAPAASNRDQRAILNRLPVGVLIYRLNRLLYANRAFLEWTGYEHLVALEEAGGLDALFVAEGAVSLEQGSNKSFAITPQGGGTVPGEGRLFMVPWEGESAFALITTNTAHQPSDTAQNELDEQKAILDTATDGVIVLDASGRVLSSNRSAQALFGYDAAELTGREFTTLFAPESERMASEYLDGLVRDGVANVLNDGREVIGRVRQGGLIPLFMTIGRIGDDANKLCAVFRDITQWKKAEEELTAAKRQAEKASSQKSDFLAKISHEIRTPLNAVIGFSEVMMEERFGPVGNDRYRQYLKDIHTSGGHLMSLINDLLDLSKIEAGKMELAFAEVALNDLTAQCVAIMQPQANRERVIIRTSLSPKLPPIVADARSVRQIVLNLLSNSIKFTGAGGQVIVSTATTDAGGVVLRVRDTGIGMNEKDIATAMEPFRQLATATRVNTGGTGLGLPLTKALAEANRAGFGIKSAPNAGTLVEITFPAAKVLAQQ